MDIENVIIIGSGPSGLAAAIYNSRADLKPLVLGGSPPGGQLTTTTEVENYPGYESIMGPELIMKMRKHAEKFGTRFMDKNVKSVNFSSDVKELILENGDVIKTKTVIITTGAEAMWLGLPNEQRLRGKGVSACATCDAFFFRGKKVAVIGGGDTAMEDALTLSKFAQEVYLVHRRVTFRASKFMQGRVENTKNIMKFMEYEVTDVLGNDKVEGILLKSSKDSSEKKVELDGVFVAIGHKPSTSFLVDSGVELDDRGYIKTTLISLFSAAKLKQDIDKSYNFDYQYMTKVPGVFAAGDCVDFTYRQASTAVGMGVSVALEVEKFLL